ncbi:MAG: glycosyltransferase [Cyanobacteria bacterium]|nr:glycosyltransferase [Cyanobacteria bacterium GSL.Bin21]
MKNLRIAWLVPSAWFYWQPTLSEFSKLFPKTKVFTALFPGYTKGYESCLDIELVGSFKVLGGQQNLAKPHYSSAFTSLSPKIILHLFQYRPKLIFTSSFGVWTILALLFKFIGSWKVVIAYEGSSPGVDFRNSPLRLWIRKIMVKIADAYITNSNAGKTYLTDILKAESTKVFAQPYEIPAAASLLDKEKIRELPSISYKQPVFLFVGRIIPRKGLHFLLEACTTLKKQGYRNYTLLIVGEGQQRPELEAFCKKNNLEHCVKWIGKVDYQDIGNYFQAADVFILPTLEDTWGVVILEAMLFGKPILCSRGAGSSELIINGENGYVFDPKNRKELAQFMAKFIENPSLISVMGIASQQQIVNYTPEIAANYLAKVVESMQHDNE